MCDILINSNMTDDIFELLEQDIITRGLYVHPYETTLDYLYTSYVKNKDKINFILSGNLTLNDNTFFTNDDNDFLFSLRNLPSRKQSGDRPVGL